MAGPRPHTLEDPMTTLLIQLTLAAATLTTLWLVVRKAQEARRIFNFHDEV